MKLKGSSGHSHSQWNLDHFVYIMSLEIPIIELVFVHCLGEGSLSVFRLSQWKVEGKLMCYMLEAMSATSMVEVLSTWRRHHMMTTDKGKYTPTFILFY